MKIKKTFLNRLAQDWPAKVLSLGAAVILFLFNRMSNLDNKYISVPLSIVGSAQVVPASEYPDTVRITLRGDAEKISFIEPEHIDAFLDCGSVTSEGEALVMVRTLRRGNALDVDPLEIKVDPIQVRLKFERREVKIVPIIPNITGSPEIGYERSAVQIAPAKVEISGPYSLITGINSVSTREFSLSGLRQDVVTALELSSPSPLVRLSSSSLVELRVAIREAVAVKRFDTVTITVNGLDPDLELESELPLGSLSVQGAQAAVEEFSLSEGVLSIDLSDYYTPQNLILPIKVALPEDLSLISFEPNEIQVKLKTRRRGETRP